MNYFLHFVFADPVFGKLVDFELWIKVSFSYLWQLVIFSFGVSSNFSQQKSPVLGFGSHPHTPRGPHGGGELSLKNPGGGGFYLEPHGVLVGFFMHFYAFLAGNFSFLFISENFFSSNFVPFLKKSASKIWNKNHFIRFPNLQ